MRGRPSRRCGRADRSRRADGRGRSELFAQTQAEADPFDEVDDFVDPAQPKAGSDDFGAGLFAEPQRHAAELDVEDDDAWLSPSLDTEPHHDERTSPFGLAALARDDDHAQLRPDADEPSTPTTTMSNPRPNGPNTTRELIEQARAAARSASPTQDAKLRAGDKSGGSLFGGFGLGGKAKKKQRGGTMRTALLVSGATAALGVALAGYVILSATRTAPARTRGRGAGRAFPRRPIRPPAKLRMPIPWRPSPSHRSRSPDKVANASPQPTAQIAVDAAGGLNSTMTPSAASRPRTRPASPRC